MPPLMIRSFSRPFRYSSPASSRQARSPVRIAPAGVSAAAVARGSSR